jgi:uncharacterized protein involved in exopolysaccharide biosynthesis
MQANQAFDALQKQIQQLLLHYKQLQQKHEKLQTQYQKSVEQTTALQEKINALEQKIAAKTVNVQNWDSEEKKELQKKINTYLKDIDTCLQMLNK